MENWAEQGYKYVYQNIAAIDGAIIGDQYVKSVVEAIDNLNKDINQFAGYQTGNGQLQGDVAEFWHGDTFNIRAAARGYDFNVTVNRSRGYASPDIKSDWGENYGLKYYKNAAASANAQSTSHFQRLCEYRYSSGRSELTISEFLSERGFENADILNDPIYSGQMRLIPVEQYDAAVEYLKYKIAKEALTRPEQVERYKNTLEMLTTKIESPDATTSIELIREGSEKLAQIAKDGKFDAADYGFTTEQLIEFQYILQQGVEAGTSAAVISLILKTAPEFYKCVEKLIKEGIIDEEDLYKVGFAALSGAGEGFLRGFTAGSLTIACKSGMFGEGLKTLNPGCIAALTVVLMQTMKDSYMVVKGNMTHYELVANISKNVFVVSCGIGLGALTQLMMPMVPFAYMLGNFVGSFIGSFAYIAIDSAFMSFAIYSGWTFFGVVKQDYVLPDEVLHEIGVDVFEYDKFEYDSFKFDEFEPDYFSFDEFQPDFISFLRRDVIGVHQIGYTYSLREFTYY